MLLQQGNDFSIGIDAEGYVKASIGTVSLSSKENVTTVSEKASGIFGTDSYQETKTTTAVIGKINDGRNHAIMLVREVNGMLKLYVDGSLSASAYEETKRNETLNGGTIVLGDASYNGYVGNVSIRNSALYYDDAQQFAQDHAIALDARPLLKRAGAQRHAASRLPCQALAAMARPWMSWTETTTRIGTATTAAAIRAKIPIRLR